MFEIGDPVGLVQSPYSAYARNLHLCSQRSARRHLERSNISRVKQEMRIKAGSEVEISPDRKRLLLQVASTLRCIMQKTLKDAAVYRIEDSLVHF